MFVIVVPGKVGAMNLRYASAADALKEYREMEADGLINIDMRNAVGDPVGAFDLEQSAKIEMENASGPNARIGSLNVIGNVNPQRDEIKDV